MAKAIYDKAYRELIELLIQSRKQKGITQEELSVMIGIPRYDISKIENYVRELGIMEIDKWLSAFDTDMNVVDAIKERLKQHLANLHNEC